jgi:epoxyqueuosine reductase
MIIDLKEAIKNRSRDAGFDDIGFVRPNAIPDAANGLQAYLRAGYHGDMAWLSVNSDRRVSPTTLWPDTKTIIMLAMNYGPDCDPLEILDSKDSAAISVYAQARDYHDLVKKRLKQVARWLSETQGAQVKVFVDTAPVMEKPLAQAAGLGWQGKHTNLVSRKFGSWTFLGSIFTDIELETDDPARQTCGSCRACLDICPTRAFPQPYRLDARRCISYLTIEYKGHIPEEFRHAMGNRIYGCDDCLAVCPWNKFASQTKETAFHARSELIAPLLVELSMLDDKAFRQMFSGSPVKRIGRDRFVRNVMIAIGNSDKPELYHAAQARLLDQSPLVRAMAVWALRQLVPDAQVATIAKGALPVETDMAVAAEWRSPLLQSMEA